MDRWLKTGYLKRRFDDGSDGIDQVQDETTSCTILAPTDSSTSVDHTDNSTRNESNVSKIRKQSHTKTRKYNDSYLSMGFTFCGDKNSPRPQCILCSEILQNSSMAPAKLQRHFETKHSEHKDKPLSFFQCKLNSLMLSKKCMQTKFKSDNENALIASFKVSYRIAREGEAHTIGEKLIKPCAIDMATSMLDEQAASKIQLVPLSDNTVQRRIQECASNILDELVRRLRLCETFTIQLDESTDVANLSILLVFVRYVHAGEFEEDLLLCKTLDTYTTGEEIFNSLDQFLTHHQISWQKCSDVCTDGAKAMTGKTAGVVARIKAVAEMCSSSHCMLHRQALAVKKMPTSLKTVLDNAIQIVNFIKARSLNCRLFRVICNDMGSEFQNLLFHTEVRWLSRGKVLVRIFQMRQEITVFFADKETPLAKYLSNITWLHQLAYLADIFTKLNALNLAMQGRSVTVLTTADKVSAMKLKLKVWTQHAKQNKFDCFETLSEYLTETGTEVSEIFKNDIVEHLIMLQNTFEEYFPPNNEDLNWLRNPFIDSLQIKHLPIKECEQLIDIFSDSTLKQKFPTTLLSSFWTSLIEEYPEIARRAVKKLLPFATTYLCESGFSRYCATKTKYRNKLDAEADIRLQLSSITPDFKFLCSSKQPHSSH